MPVIAALEATVHRVLDALAAELADLGLSHGETNALAQLAPGTRSTISELQAATGQRASTLTGVLDRLERRGLVDRRLNPADRRSFTVALTASGEVVNARVKRTFEELERQVRARVSPQAVSGYFDVLEALDGLTD